MNWDFFSHIYILNQADRIDRWEVCKTELARVGIEDYSQFLSIPADPPMKSFCISQKEMIREALNDNATTPLFLEDDVLFGHLWPLDDALTQLPTDWDILFLGCNLRGQSPEPYEMNLRRIKTAWMSHATAYSKRMCEFIVNNYHPEEGQMFDDWLCGFLPVFNAYVVAPMVAYQRPGKSDLWGAWTDYTSTIDEGNLLL